MITKTHAIRRPFGLVLFGILMLSGASLRAESAAMVAAQAQAAIDSGDYPKWWEPELPAKVRKDVENKGLQLSAVLRLDDGDKTERIAKLVSTHFGRVWAWHQEVDEKLDAAWAEWDEARSNADGKEKDELKALAVMCERIDPIYAEFAPQIRVFLSDLRAEVGDKSADVIIDAYTRSPGAKRTFDAYVAMVPEMKEDEKAVIWQRLVQAREESLAAWTGDRIIKIFKKHKVRNEFSIDYFGYGYRERYKQWASGK